MFGYENCMNCKRRSPGNVLCLEHFSSIRKWNRVYWKKSVKRYVYTYALFVLIYLGFMCDTPIQFSIFLYEKLTVFYLIKFFTFYGTWRFPTRLTGAGHWSLSLATKIQSTSPHSIPPKFSRTSKWFLVLRLLNQNFVCIFHLCVCVCTACTVLKNKIIVC